MRARRPAAGPTAAVAAGAVEGCYGNSTSGVGPPPAASTRTTSRHLRGLLLLGVLLQPPAWVVAEPPGLQPYVRVASEPELVAALSNNSLTSVQLTANLRLNASAWLDTTIVRSTNFTLVGADWLPILDLQFIESKIQLLPGVEFTFANLELRNTRQRSGFDVDIFRASPGAIVRFYFMVYFCFSCLPVSTLTGGMLTIPPATIPTILTVNNISWCRQQPRLRACYSGKQTFRVVTASAQLPASTVADVASSGGYVLEGTNVTFACEDPVDDECGRTRGYDFCVRNQIQDMFLRDTTWALLAGEQEQGSSGVGAATAAAAIGGAVAGAVALAILVIALLMLSRRRRAAAEARAAEALGGKGGAKEGASNGHRSMADDEAHGSSVTVHLEPDAKSYSKGSRSTANPRSGHNARADASVGEVLGVPHVQNAPVSASGGGSSDALGTRNISGGKAVFVEDVQIELDSLLGIGSFGKVFRGTWQGQRVAVKVLQYGVDLARAVGTEVQLSKRLRHRNVVSSLHFVQVLPGGMLSSSVTLTPRITNIPAALLESPTARLPVGAHAPGAPGLHAADAASYSRFIVSGAVSSDQSPRADATIPVPAVPGPGPSSAGPQPPLPQSAHEDSAQTRAGPSLASGGASRGLGSGAGRDTPAQAAPWSSSTAAMPCGVSGAMEALWMASHTQPAAGCSHGFLVMELCEGGTLQAWRAGRWAGEVPDLGILARLALHVAHGVQYIHSQGVCHGDLKLSNILLARTTPTGTEPPATEGLAVLDPIAEGYVAKVCDFGLAHILSGDRSHVSTRPLGTPTHMAPELWSCGHVSPQADVYALGILVWELVTGDRPYRGLSAAQILNCVLNGARPVLPPWMPGPLTSILERCWAAAPKERPAMADIVEQFNGLQLASTA